jgi:hypothetical protein
MLDHDQLTPEETWEQNQPLIQDLRRYYNTRAEDSASLSRIQVRLLEKTATSLPVTGSHEMAQAPLQLQRQRARNTGKKLEQAFTKDRPRYRSLGTLAAAILLVALVGSFALLLHHGQGTGTVKHGWSLVAKLSGRGSQTITGQNIEVGQKFRLLITCTNTLEGRVDIKYNIGTASTMCSVSRSTSLGPGDIAISPARAFPTIHTIEVTTDASTSWELFFFRDTSYSPLTIDTADWQSLLSEMDGTGNENVTWGDVTLPRTLALQFVCHGTGYIQISLQQMNNTSEIAGARALCNGQTNFDVTDLSGQSEKVFQVQITTGADNDWQVLLAGCTNGKPRCGITTVIPTSTP